MPVHGGLVAVEDVAVGRYAYLRLVRQNSAVWCRVRSNQMLRRYRRLTLYTPDGQGLWWRMVPGTMVRVADAPRVEGRPEVDMARDALTDLYLSTMFTVRDRKAVAEVSWIDGPSALSVVPAMARRGVTRIRCHSEVSLTARAAVAVRFAREGTPDSRDRPYGIEQQLNKLAELEWYLGRHLAAFCGDDDGEYDQLCGMVERLGLSNLAVLADTAVPDPIVARQRCHGQPEFVATNLRTAAQQRLCGRCLGRYQDGTYEMAPLQR